MDDMRSTLQSLATRFGGREYHDGTVAANRLGLQVARTLVMNARVSRAGRRRLGKPNPTVDTLRRDGVALVPDFLPSEVFARVHAEFHAALGAGLLVPEPCEEDNGIVEDRISVSKNRQHFPVTWRELGENQELRDIVGDVIGQTPRGTALIISVMRKSEVPTSPARLIGANYIHADIHFPSVKAWLYLDDIDESNGAMTYAAGSHRVTLARLAYEYEASIRVARAKLNGDVHVSVPYGLARMPTTQQLKRMAIVETPLCGKANTLVFANTQGFHRRGEFQPSATRHLLMIRFGDRRGKGRVG